MEQAKDLTYGVLKDRLLGAFSKISEQGANAGGPFGGTMSVVKTSWVLPVIAIIVTIALIVIIVLVVNTHRAAVGKEVLKGPTDLFDPKSVVVVSRQDASKQMKGSYTLSFYARIDAVPDMRASVTLLTYAGTWALEYNPAEEQMLWNFGQTPDSGLPFGSAEVVKVGGATLQRWNQYVIAVEGRSVDFYINGVLVKSHLLDNVTPAPVGSITIVPKNVMGQIAVAQLWSRRLTTTEVATNYTDTSDSQGQPFLGSALMKTIGAFKLPNLFCPGGNCDSATPTASPSQIWEFPYA
jgi:hypothetical protein